MGAFVVGRWCCKANYDLKKAYWMWYDKIDTFLLEQGIITCQVNPNLCYLFEDGNHHNLCGWYFIHPKPCNLLSKGESPNSCNFVDTDYVGNLNGWKSMMGYIFIFRNGPISWNNKKQGCVATSSTKAEYMALFEVASKTIWLGKLLEEIQVQNDVVVIVQWYNQSCMKMVFNFVFHN